MLIYSSNSVDESPSLEDSSFPTSKNIWSILWKSKFHYFVYKSLPLVSIPSQINPVNIFPSFSCKSNINIIVPTSPRIYRCFFQIFLQKLCT
jgi:hypothetical protein